MLLACTLLVAAASDLAPLEQKMAAAVPECQVRFSFASSGTLARQIVHGADFDLFLAANRRYVDEVVKGRAAEASTVRAYARGRIAVWSLSGISWKTLTKASRISIANPVHAPYGAAAKQALERQGLWAAVSPNIVYGENIRQAYQFAVTGNADATVTSWSLVHDKGGDLLPESWHDPIVQTAVIPRRGTNPAAAARFLNWLTSAAGQKILSEAGLMPVR
jgi:molybdate transport system substrate-binding protein